MISTTTWIFSVITALLMPLLSFAQDSKNQGYLVNTNGNNLVTSSATGLCSRTSDWTPARALASCDADVFKTDVPIPKVVAPASLPQKPVLPRDPATAKTVP